MELLGDGDPRRIGPYVLMGRLGTGGMGSVYLGRSAGGRTVAVKVVRAGLSEDPGFRDRFRREVLAARRVSGAFTAPVVDADPEAVTPWMATAFVVGVSLHQAVLRHGPLPEGTVRTLAAGLAEALVEVHAAELVHRDLKPANVLLALDGPHVIDFGISQAADGTALTTGGAVIGSAAYMSPEQALGRRLGPAGDVFSLGTTLAFAALGGHLFGDGASAAVLFRVVNTEPDLSGLPAGLRELVAACLAKDPGGRPTPRQVIEYVTRDGWAGPTANWLPPAVAGDVVALRSVLTALPEPPPDGGPAPADAVPPRAPSRRTLLLGLGGGLLAAAGAGTAAALASAGGGGKNNGLHGKITVTRPDWSNVREGVLSWKVNPSQDPNDGPRQVLPSGGLVLTVSLQHVQALDSQGHAKWTVNAADHGVMLAVGELPVQLAAVDGDVLYVGATAEPAPGATAASGKQYGSPALLAIGVADGAVRWTATLDQPNTMSSTRLLGFLDNRAYLLGSGDGTDGGSSGMATSFHVWAVDLTSHQTAWFHGSSDVLISGALPQGGDHAVVASTKQFTALDGNGNVVWTKSQPAAYVAGAGKYVLLYAQSGALTACDPATGNPVWSAPTGLLASGSGDAIALSPDGATCYGRWLDTDGGSSLVALDPATGHQRWRAPLPVKAPNTGNTGGSRLLQADGNLYLMDDEAVVWAFDPATGKPRWRFSGFKGTDPGTLGWAAGDGRVCIVDPNGTAVAVLPSNGV
ncbi:protein kinase domain-containing protein [Kitasatospora viridis]|uniref:Serine/threonine protein kinase n=1 Tax=Kitasatospora viridis TaxID=281105 RepID=A0A561S944_9ACTN|nr:serine/threonine-protein kinase [Kitasatospora viridis]TWF71398.1 serine/threonine protein kinase [Kitasatospora viridis]